MGHWEGFTIPVPGKNFHEHFYSDFYWDSEEVQACATAAPSVTKQFT